MLQRKLEHFSDADFPIINYRVYRTSDSMWSIDLLAAAWYANCQYRGNFHSLRMLLQLSLLVLHEEQVARALQWSWFAFFSHHDPPSIYFTSRMGEIYHLCQTHSEIWHELLFWRQKVFYLLRYRLSITYFWGEVGGCPHQTCSVQFYLHVPSIPASCIPHGYHTLWCVCQRESPA